MFSPPRINVLGVGISVLTLDSAVDAVVTAVQKGQQGYVTVTGVHGVSECQTDADCVGSTMSRSCPRPMACRSPGWGGGCSDPDSSGYTD